MLWEERKKAKGPKCSRKGVAGVSHKKLFLTNYLYINALWWSLCFLVLNWGRRRNSALQGSFSAEEQFSITSSETATDLWARPGTHMHSHTGPCTELWTSRWSQTHPSPSALCFASPSVIQGQTSLGCKGLLPYNVPNHWLYEFYDLHMIPLYVYSEEVGMFPTYPHLFFLVNLFCFVGWLCLFDEEPYWAGRKMERWRM